MTAVLHPRVAAAPGRRHAPTPGGARPGCARSRRRRTPRRDLRGAPQPGPVRRHRRHHRRRRVGPRGGRRRRRGVDGQRRPAGARRRRPRRPWSRRSPPSPAGSPRCWPATCRSPSSSTPRRPASSCCPTAASSAPTCTCDAWADPCPHALAVLYQLAWLVEADPLVLCHLRGLAATTCSPSLHDAGADAGPGRRRRRPRAGARRRAPGGSGARAARGARTSRRPPLVSAAGHPSAQLEPRQQRVVVGQQVAQHTLGDEAHAVRCSRSERLAKT